jgi:hypothetical protein
VYSVDAFEKISEMDTKVDSFYLILLGLQNILNHRGNSSSHSPTPHQTLS